MLVYMVRRKADGKYYDNIKKPKKTATAEEREASQWRDIGKIYNLHHVKMVYSYLNKLIKDQNKDLYEVVEFNLVESQIVELKTNDPDLVEGDEDING